MILIGLPYNRDRRFAQSSCYVPINRIKSWSWESYWIVRGVFACACRFLGHLAVPPAIR